MVRTSLVTLLVLSLGAVGCTSYYIVRDPGSGATYFTTDYDQKKSGAVTLEDEKTGAHVTIQSSEIREVNKDEYKAVMKSVAPAPSR